MFQESNDSWYEVIKKLASIPKRQIFQELNDSSYKKLAQIHNLKNFQERSSSCNLVLEKAPTLT